MLVPLWLLERKKSWFARQGLILMSSTYIWRYQLVRNKDLDLKAERRVVYENLGSISLKMVVETYSCSQPTGGSRENRKRQEKVSYTNLGNIYHYWLGKEESRLVGNRFCFPRSQKDVFFELGTGWFESQTWLCITDLGRFTQSCWGSFSVGKDSYWIS